ncbi:hypothetical protein LOTGIDRAFT_151283 [Lottia gigantea]|uniref:Protein UXT n=1 Tax=Lottia gigantea TaxID=225164 RepID=V4AJM1_LOTGI|nr:hypothetical protein LOTGIDRAFT_151283 [Lottia gigantea]ESP04359.1 hypothetical protein LOTGIDRAFT_151283 [Lottia gigantea]
MDEKTSKVIQYETFLNNTLREDLKKILEARDKIHKETSDYLQLKIVIERLQESQLLEDELKTKIDLGNSFFVQAKVTDASKICVAIGYGFFVEFTFEEALKFIQKKTTRLSEHANVLTQDASRIKAKIKLVMEGLREMQGLPAKSVKPFRDIL